VGGWLSGWRVDRVELIVYLSDFWLTLSICSQTVFELLNCIHICTCHSFSQACMHFSYYYVCVYSYFIIFIFVLPCVFLFFFFFSFFFFCLSFLLLLHPFKTHCFVPCLLPPLFPSFLGWFVCLLVRLFLLQST
jgi:hypothetical protein